MGTAGIVPGWYADPTVAGHLRYWDGSGWTDHTAAPLASAITHPSTAYFANASLPNAPTLPPAPPRPRRRLPLPALFVLGTALVGIPLAIGIGALAARASAPPPLETPVPAENLVPPKAPLPVENAADAVAKTDAAALQTAITRFFQQTWAATPPVVTVSEGNYVFAPVPYGGKTWTWPPIAVSDGVSLRGQNGDSMDTWCVWVRIDGGAVKDWQATPAGVTAGSCRLG